jgi:predicted transposase YbfD/YdcC
MESAAKQPTAPESLSALQHLVDRYRDFPDYRLDNDNKKHLLADILVSAICAVLGGANSWLAVERFCVAHETWLRSFLELPNGIPSHDTYRLVFLSLDPEEMNRRFAGWMSEICRRLAVKQVAFDGKTMRGSGGGRTGLQALHLVHAFAIENGICLGQQAVASKSNEITAIPELLKLLDLKGALVTIDALGCQKEIADDVVTGGGDYLLAVKGNQEHLHEDVQQSMAPLIAGPCEPGTETCAQTEEVNRGRKEKRTCYISTDLSRIRDQSLWKGLQAIGVIISEREVNGKQEVETRYFISSRVLSASTLLQGVRNHWKVENQLHWVLDVVFGEDGHQLRVGHGPRNFTTLRKLAHAMIKNCKPKHGIKGTREMAGWNTAFLEEIVRQAVVFAEKPSA